MEMGKLGRKQEHPGWREAACLPPPPPSLPQEETI